MTSEQVQRYLIERGKQEWQELPEPVRRYLENCPDSRALWEFMKREESAAAPSPEVRSRIESSILSSLKPVAPLPSARALALGFLIIFALSCAGLVGLTGVRGLAGIGSAQFVGLLSLVVAVSFLVALVLSGEMVPGETRNLSPVLLFSVGMLTLVTAVVLLFPWETASDFLPHSWHCFRVGFLSSLPAGGLVVWLLHRGSVLRPSLVGAGAGLLTGLVGVVQLHFGCPMHSAPHIALGHLGIPLATAVAGYSIGRYLTARRRRAAGGD